MEQCLESPKKINTLLFDENAEKSVLGSIFYNPSVISTALDYLRPVDFFKYTHSLIFSSMISLYEKNEHIDPITVFDEICRAKKLKPEDTFPDYPEYLDALSLYSGTDRIIETYSDIVKERSIRRLIIQISKETIAMASDSSKGTKETIEHLQKRVYSLSLDYKSRNLHEAKNLYSSIVNEIKISSATKKPIEEGIPSGFKSLDEITIGFKPSDFIIIGARPSVGKTALSFNIATHIALRENKSVLFFSLEMTAKALMKRIMSSENNIERYKIEKGILNASELKTLIESQAKFDSSRFHIEDTSYISLFNIKSLSRKIKKTNGLDIIFIDYISLISTESRDIPRYEVFAFISNSLKGLSDELNIPVVALSQLTRDTEERKPNLASLRESGALEQVADLVILLSKDKENENDSKYERNIELTVAKHRNGAVGKVNMKFLPMYTKFVC